MPTSRLGARCGIPHSAMSCTCLLFMRLLRVNLVYQVRFSRHRTLRFRCALLPTKLIVSCCLSWRRRLRSPRPRPTSIGMLRSSAIAPLCGFSLAGRPVGRGAIWRRREPLCRLRRVGFLSFACHVHRLLGGLNLSSFGTLFTNTVDLLGRTQCSLYGRRGSRPARRLRRLLRSGRPKVCIMCRVIPRHRRSSARCSSSFLASIVSSLLRHKLLGTIRLVGAFLFKFHGSHHSRNALNNVIRGGDHAQNQTKIGKPETPRVQPSAQSRKPCSINKA